MQKFPFTSQLCSAAIAAALLLTGCTTADVRNEQPQVAATQQTEAPLIPIENFFNEQSIRHLKMSDDGKWLAFISRVGGAFKLHVMDLASGAVNAITDTTADENPSFAPNSRLLVYATQQQGREALMTTTLDGKIKARLAGQAGDIREPDWGSFQKQ